MFECHRRRRHKCHVVFDINLPADSLYQEVLPEIQKRGVGNDVSSKSAPADFARGIVKDTLGGAAGPVWRGAVASMVKLMSKYVPTGKLVCSIVLFHFSFLFDMD